MELGKWRRQFDPKILRRGEDYYVHDAVQSLHWDGETITATVCGMDDYDVEIRVSHGQVAEMSCSCPYAEQDNCKHMAAVLLAASREDFPDGGAEQENAASTRGRKGKEIPLKDAVQSLKAADARDLLLRFAKVYPDIAEQIMLKTAGTVTDGQIQAWSKRIISLTVQYSDRRGFIDYRHARGYTRDLQSLLDEKVPILLECGLPMEAFALTCKALQEASEIAMDDSDGGLGDLYWNCEAHWREILPRMNRVQRHGMFDWFAENYDRWDVADEIFDAFLFGTNGQEAEFQETEFLYRKLDLLDKQIAKAAEDSYTLGHLLILRLDTMKSLSMDRADIEAYLREHRENSDIRQYMIDEAIRETRYDDAVSLLRESKELDSRYAGLVSDYSGKLVELYRTLDRVEDLRAELMFQMEQVWQRDLEYVNQLKDITPPDQWPDLRERLLSLKNLDTIRGDLLEQEGQYERLLGYVQKSGRMEVMDRYVETLKKEYPEQVLAFYVSCLRQGMKAAGNRSGYAELVRRLKTVSRLRGGKEAAASLAGEWRAAWPRRRAMLEELGKAGF